MKHTNILLVDDDADDQLIFKDALNEIAAGIECATANNGLEALDYLKATVLKPTLIFLDLNMPFMNGFECLARIKKEDPLKEIPIVIFTTSDYPGDEQRTKELGAEIFLTKGPSFKLLKEKLLDILRADF